MRMLATAQLGDHLATLCQDGALGPAGGHYALTFTDLPTGRTSTMQIVGENDAILTFAAWLAADETNLGALERLRNLLQTHCKDVGPDGIMP